MTEQKSLRMGLSAFDLKLMAMVFMLCDHMWATIIHGHDWLTCIGRLAFPIFAFLIAEGYAHTHDARAYRRRMLLWALIAVVAIVALLLAFPEPAAQLADLLRETAAASAVPVETISIP